MDSVNHVLSFSFAFPCTIAEPVIPLQDYSTEGLTETQMSLMQQLRQFGLIYQRKVVLYNISLQEICEILQNRVSQKSHTGGFN